MKGLKSFHTRVQYSSASSQSSKNTKPPVYKEDKCSQWATFSDYKRRGIVFSRTHMHNIQHTQSFMCVRACMCAGGPSGAVSGDRRITQQLLRVLAASPATAIIRNKARMRSNCQLSTHVCLHLFALKLRLSPRRIFNSQISGNLFSFCLSLRRSDHKPPAIRHHGERLTIAKTTFAQSPTNSVHTSRVLNVTIGHTGAESFFRRPT